MTTQKLFKRRVRERMSKTGESYTAARRHVAPERERLETDRTRLASAKELAADEKLTEATGQDWEAWLSLLDRWGAGDRKHGETADFLITQHGVPGWWAQTITVGYERARGLRLKHQQPNGFTIYASKTFPVPIDVLYDALVDEGNDPSGSRTDRCRSGAPSPPRSRGSIGATAHRESSSRSRRRDPRRPRRTWPTSGSLTPKRRRPRRRRGRRGSRPSSPSWSRPPD